MRTSDPCHELFLNYACNAKCPFCYNPPITPELLRRELTYEQALRSLKSGADSGARRLNLHGGEVTLRDDLPRILLAARRLGFRETTVVTNGLRLSSAEYVRELASCGATHFRLSIHGPDARTHDGILAIPGAFERVLRAIGNVRASAIPLGINFVLIRRNLRTLPDFLKKFCLEMGIDDVIVYFPHLRGMMAINADEEAIAYADVAPHVRRALRLLPPARRNAVMLANFVPCVLPEFSGLMLDWSHAPGETTMTHPEGFTDEVGRMKDGQRAAVAACASCEVRERCLGVEREYRDRFGESGFRPLARDPEAAGT